MERDTIAGQSSDDLPSLLGSRFQTIIWACLDYDLISSAVFFGERYFVQEQGSTNHDARHLYATALFRAGQTHSALNLVMMPQQIKCSGCADIRSQCYSKLGKNREARAALDECLADPTRQSPARPPREFTVFSEESVLHCRAGTAALKANLHEKATLSFRQALSLNPMLWEAFTGLCAVGSFPEINELFPERPPPIKQTMEDVTNIASSSRGIHAAGPVTTGAGFFTPDGATVIRGWRPDPGPPQPFRIGGHNGFRDSIATNDSFYQSEISIIGSQLRPPQLGVQAPGLIPRPLSSAEETGPVPKKPRSLSRTAATADTEKLKQSNAGVETRSKKARARQVLTSSNSLSPPSHKHAPSTRNKQSTAATIRVSKNEAPTANNAPVGSRRSTRLLSGAGKHVVKHPPTRERRRQPAHLRTRSTESDFDEEAICPSSPPSAHSPRSEGSPVPPVWSAAQEQAAQEAYEIARADLYIYDLMRLFACAVRALGTYDCIGCCEALDRLPERQQRSASVMALVGRARYELAEYVKAERFFTAARNLEPFRLWDMDVYSTTLWHLQRNVSLSFLAQELLSIDPRSPQAWIAVGNCFSLQKERSQALTCFRRAAQLDPSCAYAYTLSGHESTEEDLDKAIGFFQSALRADPRHYNAWYGLGTCYIRLSKLRLAEYHYRKAVSIHPQNAVLIGCLGLAVERRGAIEEAFELYNTGVRLSSDNELVRYRRAKLLIAMKKYQAAINDLERLRETSPEESNIVFQLARVYRLVGNESKATQMLAIARDMSPKSLNKIKRLLETEKDGGNDEMEEG